MMLTIMTTKLNQFNKLTKLNKLTRLSKNSFLKLFTKNCSNSIKSENTKEKDMQVNIDLNYSTHFTKSNIQEIDEPCIDELKAREELALCHRICEWLKLNEGVDNHLTMALPCNTKFLIGCYGIAWNRVTASNLLLVDINGNVLRGKGTPQLAGFTIHSNLHRGLGYKRAKVILHTHQPYTTALSVLSGEHGKIQNIHQNSCRFYNSVMYDNNYRGIVESKEEGERLLNLMLQNEKYRIIMMGNHGISTVAPSAAEALTDLYYLEAFCKVQVLALSAAGGDLTKLRYLRQEIVEFTHNQYRADPFFFANKLLDGWRKTMEHKQPDYKL